MRVGWYVHHHGAGHAHRLAAVRPWLRSEVTVFTSRDGELPLDVDDREPRDPTAGGTLHWAPLGVDGLSDRMARIADWIAAARPDAFVVDVSVEVALLARLLGVPTIYVLQRGRRTDPAHALAYTQAAAVVAPWTAATHHGGDYPVPPDAIDFTGAISRFDGVPFEPPGDDVLLLVGGGGHAIDLEASVPAEWQVADGRGDVASLLSGAGVVVGTGGGNVVAEVAAARRPYVCVPQERPFAEQHRQADALRRIGVAEVRESWPAPDEWPGVLRRARQRDVSRWGELHDGRGAERFAAVVDRVAAG